ncbi:hypothetical protein Enr13x_71130 [Stieleria neptunia]|uniref:Uncharacterized protein n=1 Tax=Stieleria neptunia TaxID=2527979 RepID=A0A518I2D4_9BACT|nr:hypothetical protein [Stieleria neptunia]QDV47204.1 hypothetical protein Enr13x_71130 [Stieleria neptunia]
MINPYQAPTEIQNSAESAEHPSAEFLVTTRQLRHAESKFLLYRCGGRLTLASFVMIALSFLVAFDGLLPFGPSAATGQFQVPLVFRQLAVMGLATVVYLGLIIGVRKESRAQLASHGIVEGAGISVRIMDGLLQWSGPGGTFTVPLTKTRPIRTRKGVIVVVDRDLYLFIPQEAAFAGGPYRTFVRAVVA